MGGPEARSRGFKKNKVEAQKNVGGQENKVGGQKNKVGGQKNQVKQGVKKLGSQSGKPRHIRTLPCPIAPCSPRVCFWPWCNWQTTFNWQVSCFWHSAIFGACLLIGLECPSSMTSKKWNPKSREGKTYIWPWLRPVAPVELKVWCFGTKRSAFSMGWNKHIVFEHPLSHLPKSGALPEWWDVPSQPSASPIPS